MMKSYILMATFILGSAVTPLHAEKKEAVIRLRDLEISGLSIDRDNVRLTASFDVKQEQIFDELIFDFYLLLQPQNNDMKPQFMHCRTIHRYIEKKSSQETSVGLSAAVIDCIDPRKEQYAVVVTYKGKEVGMENSEKERWWEDEDLGEPVENILFRSSSIPIVRVWESAR